MGGKGHSDHSEGKEVSDGQEKAGSDGSEGSEASEVNRECIVDPSQIDLNMDLQQMAMLYKKEQSPFSIFQF